MNESYIINDADGKPVNAKYPPNKEIYGEEFGGYKNSNAKIIFHDFVVLSKDVSFVYNGVEYYFYLHNTPATVYNANLKEIIGEYSNRLELIEKFLIDGKPFMKIIDEIGNVKTFVNVFKPYYVLDENAFPCNSKYPPCKEKYGFMYSGYRNAVEETLFYDFGIHGYDLYFKYKGKEYFVLSEFNYVALCDEHYTKEYEVYANAMDFIENFKIDGKPLIELFDDIEEIYPE